MLRTASIRTNHSGFIVPSLIQSCSPIPESFSVSPVISSTTSSKRPAMLHSMSTESSIKFKHADKSHGNITNNSIKSDIGKRRRAAKAVLSVAGNSREFGSISAIKWRHPQHYCVYLSADEDEHRDDNDVDNEVTSPCVSSTSSLPWKQYQPEEEIPVVTFTEISSIELVHLFNQPAYRMMTSASSTSTRLLLLLDIRDVGEFTRSHIQSAESMSCRVGRLKMRRAIQGLTSNRLTSSDQPIQVVLYDGGVGMTSHQTMSLEDRILNGQSPPANRDSVRTLLDFLYANFVNIRFLADNFASFQTQFPFLCTSGSTRHPGASFTRLDMTRVGGVDAVSLDLENKRDQFSKMRNFKTIDNIHDIYSANATRILSFLYLGNEHDALNTGFLETNQITHVLNVTKNSEFADPTRFCCKRISIMDSMNQDLYSFFDEAFEFIEMARTQNGAVLVHCQAGVSRSATIVIAYLLKHSRISKCHSLQDSLQLVKSKRPIVSPNFGFLGQLNRFEREMSSTTRMRDGDDEDSQDSTFSNDVKTEDEKVDVAEKSSEKFYSI